MRYRIKLSSIYVYIILISEFPFGLAGFHRNIPKKRTPSSSHVGQLQTKAVVWLCKESMAVPSALKPVLGLMMSWNLPKHVHFTWFWLATKNKKNKICSKKKQGTSPLIPYQWCSFRPKVMASRYSRSYRHLSHIGICGSLGMRFLMCFFCRVPKGWCKWISQGGCNKYWFQNWMYIVVNRFWWICFVSLAN